MITATLRADKDNWLLPFWLDYHRDIFDSYWLLEEDADITRVVQKFCPEWQVLAPDYESIHIFTPYDFVLFDGERESLTPLQNNSHIQKWHVCLENPNYHPKTSIDILSNIRTVFAYSTGGESNSSNLAILSFRSSNDVQLFESYSDSRSIKQSESANITKISEEYYEYQTTEESSRIMNWISERILALKNTDYIYYVEPYADCDWGEDRVVLAGDINLLENTDFNDTGYKIFPIVSPKQPESPVILSTKENVKTVWKSWLDICLGLLCRSSPSDLEIEIDKYVKSEDVQVSATVNYNDFWREFMETQIHEITGKRILAESYHECVTEEEHKRIINTMPYKIMDSSELQEFAEHMESRVSEIVGQKVKTFNDDVWVRICRPDRVSTSDYNPCHRDVYLDFYRNIVNIYVPIVGSNELSSLTMEPGSHLWNERDTMVTKGGAEFKNSGKKYSVDAIVQSRRRLNMACPNPCTEEFLLFSPYLIHGCSSNANTDVTRMSIEMRFILDTEAGRAQETAFNEFLKSRVWR